MTEPSHAVFLSYASQDAAAAERIAAALRAAGVEVFLDQSELRGGDLWDQKIRREIHDCALFMPIVSQHTQERLEGYFRREWKLAIERMHDMAEQKAFLVPVVIDSTGDRDAVVPDLFRASQWTRLPGGETSPAFVERVRRLLAPAEPHVPTPGHPLTGPVSAATRPTRGLASASWSKRVRPLAAGVVVLAAVAYLAINKPWMSKPQTASPTPTSAGSTAFAPPPHSIAVLPFVNLSGDKEQEYFSDGLTEELLNSLAEINELQVAARTSAFSFKGTNTDIGTIARKLNVGAVLEGSVRRSAHTIRITAQLINSVTGFHLWSKTYDRDLGDVLKLQTEIATAVASALKVTLLGDVAAKVELGGTRNPAAFDAYLRGLRQRRGETNAEEARLPVDTFAEAIRLDPDYALAFAARSLALSFYASYYAQLAEIPGVFAKARADAERAIVLAPMLGEAHLAKAVFLDTTLDFTRSDDEYDRALSLAPGNAPVVLLFARHAARLGRSEVGLAAAQRSVVLDPLNVLSHQGLGDVLFSAHRYNEAIVAYTDAIAVDPAPPESYARRGYSYYLLGNLQMAQSSCQMKLDYYQGLVCVALTLEKLGRHDEAEAIIPKLVQMGGDSYAYQFTQIHAQWGNNGKALEWLETAMRLRDPGLTGLKTDPLLDPLRQEPRFRAIEQALNFPK